MKEVYLTRNVDGLYTVWDATACHNVPLYRGRLQNMCSDRWEDFAHPSACLEPGA